MLRADEDDREVEDLAGLDQHERLEQLVERPEAALAEDEALGRLHEHRLARVEVVERELAVEVARWRSCSCGSSMLKPIESPPASWQPRFAASMIPGPPAGDDGEAGLGEPPPDLARALVRRVAVSGSAPSRRRSRPGRRSRPRPGSPRGTPRRSSPRAGRGRCRPARGSPGRRRGPGVTAGAGRRASRSCRATRSAARPA